MLAFASWPTRPKMDCCAICSPVAVLLRTVHRRPAAPPPAARSAEAADAQAPPRSAPTAATEPATPAAAPPSAAQHRLEQDATEDHPTDPAEATALLAAAMEVVGVALRRS